MKKITEFMRALPDFYPASGASAGMINDAEKQLGVTFSKEYREYVKAFGDASANGHELTGISSNKRIDVVSVTMAERTRNQDIPEDFYVVEQTHIDRIVVWQDAHGFIYQTIPGGMPEKICETLCDYLAS